VHHILSYVGIVGARQGTQCMGFSEEDESVQVCGPYS